jgi:aryl-alcohol dehydrogenase-like predicted oxidoreductase
LNCESNEKEETNMKKRKMGKLSVSGVGYGCMGLSGTYGASDDQAAIALLRNVVELGVDFFDTADAYGPFRNEELVGEALAPVRDKVIIATKFGQQFLPDGSRRINGRPDYVRSACEASLKRLGIKQIDLYFAHRIDKTVPIEDTVGEMSRLVSEGKVRYIGLSEASANTIRRAHAVHPLTCVQTEYSAWSRDVEASVLPTVRELGIGFIAYSPLGRGFLTANIASQSDLPEGDVRRTMPRFQAENLKENRAIADRFADLAKKKGITPAQLALAWVLARGDDIVPIPGSRRLAAVKENVAAPDVQLTAAEIAVINSNLPAAKGDRYGAPMMAALDT